MNENEKIELLTIEPQPLMADGTPKLDPPHLAQSILKVILTILTPIVKQASGKTFKIFAYAYNPLVYIFNELTAYNWNPENYKPKELPQNTFIAITPEEVTAGKVEKDENIPLLKVILKVLISIMDIVNEFMPLAKNEKGQTIAMVYTIALNTLIDLLANEESSETPEADLPTEFNMVTE